MLPKVRDEIADAAANAASSVWFERIARFGYAAKGAVFLIIGILAVRMAFGERGEEPDAPGALEALGDQPLTAALLVVMAAGLTSYSLWRFAQAILDVEGEGTEWRGILNRVIYAGIGMSYGAFAVVSVLVLTGWRRDEEDGVRELTTWALQLPLGAVLVGIAGAVVMLGGLRELFVAVTGRFRDEFAREQMNGLERALAKWIGWYGHAARGAAFLVAGYFAIRAAVNYDPDEARGMADTLQAVADERYGTTMLLAIAAGFIAFGLYCGLLALHRHMPNDTTEDGPEKSPAG
jgi:hypothetical protein